MAAQRKHTADVIQLRLDEDAIIANAIDILSRRLSSAGTAMGSPAAVKSFLTLQLAAEEREVFSVLWLDARNRLIAYEAMFFGTLTHTSVYPREVVKAALKHNAASLIVAHFVARHKMRLMCPGFLCVRRTRLRRRSAIAALDQGT
jgi:DNA repair protein RadC